MRKPMVLTAFLISIPVFVSGCSTDLPTGDALFVVHGQTTAEAASKIESESPPESYTVLYEAPELERAVYEPVSGSYTGALLDDGVNLKTYNNDIKHAVYVFDMELGGEISNEGILSCISAQATPLVTLHPKNGVMSLAEISRAAKWLGNYNLPMFVSFYPVSPDMEVSSDEYKVYFRHARALLKMFAPKAAAVWLADVGAKDANDYYPGHDVVDWVGLMSQNGWNEESFTEFYMTYQKDKPVMLGPFGVSHFSDTDYIYYTIEAAAELQRIYSAVRDTFPRVKLVCYADVNLIPKGGHHDFSVSRDEELAAVYSEITSDRYFIKKLVTSMSGSQIGWLRSASPGYFADGDTKFSGGEVKNIDFIIPDHGKKVMYVYAKR